MPSISTGYGRSCTRPSLQDSLCARRRRRRRGTDAGCRTVSDRPARWGADGAADAANRASQGPSGSDQFSRAAGASPPTRRQCILPCARPAEEIGLSPAHVDIAGYLPEYLTSTGFRVTPVVAMVTPPFELQLDAFEVAGGIRGAARFPAGSRQSPAALAALSRPAAALLRDALWRILHLGCHRRNHHVPLPRPWRRLFASRAPARVFPETAAPLSDPGQRAAPRAVSRACRRS
jgi:hypothetical protein